MSGNARKPKRSASDRLLAVLTAFSTAQPSMSLTELAAATGLPLSTTHRITAQLCRWGALERGVDMRFRVGPQVERLAGLAVRQHDLREVAAPYMQDVFSASNENVQLTVRDGTRVVCLEKLRGHHSLPTTTRVGTRRFLHATSSGKLFLAFSGSGLMTSLTSNDLPRCTPKTITRPEVLAQSVSHVRETGVGYAMEETANGVSAVAAPIFAADGRVIASVGVVAPSSSDVRAYSPTVRQAARGITQQIAKKFVG